MLARATFEILRAVPVAEVEVAARVARPGRSVELLEGELSAGGEPVMLVRAWRVKATTAPDVHRDEPPPPRPDEAAPLPPEMSEFGYGHAVELRFAAGGWWQQRPATVWTRMRVPLVAGEEPTGVQRVLVVADSGNGVSAVLPFDQWLFINTELTVHFRRAAARRVDLPRRRDLDRGRRRRPRALGAQRRRGRGRAGRSGAAGRAAWRRTHSCMATAEAAAALIERVEPNWRMASTAVDSSRASGERPGPSWPNSSTQRSGSG